jgi:hypothetical protein
MIIPNVAHENLTNEKVKRVQGTNMRTQTRCQIGAPVMKHYSRETETVQAKSMHTWQWTDIKYDCIFHIVN